MPANVAIARRAHFLMLHLILKYLEVRSMTAPEKSKLPDTGACRNGQVPFHPVPNAILDRAEGIDVNAAYYVDEKAGRSLDIGNREAHVFHATQCRQSPSRHTHGFLSNRIH